MARDIWGMKNGQVVRHFEIRASRRGKDILRYSAHAMRTVGEYRECVFSQSFATQDAAEVYALRAIELSGCTDIHSE